MIAHGAAIVAYKPLQTQQWSVKIHNRCECIPFGVKHLYARAHFARSSAVPGLNGVCGPSLSGVGMVFTGGPRCGPLAIPLRRARLASDRLCRRLSGSRMLVAVVLHLLCADKSAGTVRHVKCRIRCPPWGNGRQSWCSALLRRSSFRLLLSSGAKGGSGGHAGMPPRGRRAGAGRFDVRPRLCGWVKTGLDAAVSGTVWHETDHVSNVLQKSFTEVRS